ncbi:non-ribosomal peptide synthetase [Pelomonas sp. CA6]|nr:non-ribosomal peptide synthetase [Pelomonas sp. CA6]
MVREHADSAAVVHGGRQLSYAQLDAAANRLARALAARGVGVGAAVATRLERSLELVVAQLALVKLGAVYVPLDPQMPEARQQLLAEDSGAGLMLLAPDSAAPGFGVATLAVSLDALADFDASPLQGVPQDAEAPAYIMYTSGSTGRPKGVLVPHRAISRVVVNNGYAAFDATDRVAFASNPAFDASTVEVWGALLNGGCLQVISADTMLDAQRLAEALRTGGVTSLFLTTALFNQLSALIPQELSRLRYLMTGGERHDEQAFERVLAAKGEVRLIHCYGPTETTVYALTHDVSPADVQARCIPIGRPIGNTEVHLLDAHLRPVPRGAVGEICIGGPGLALGYLNQPELTAQAFVDHPLKPGRKLYRSGDLGRWNEDGRLEFIGRRDQQVKLRGFRVELGEIQSALLAQPGIREAIVLAREDEPRHKRLVAYVVGEPQAGPGLEALRDALALTLPGYMVPSAFVSLEALPLTPNGKVDRRALPAPEADDLARRGYEAPQGEAEAQMAALWAEVLQLPRVGRHDHFFELGGHSLLAISLIARLRQAGLDSDVRTLFAQPKLSDFVAAIATVEIVL